MFALWASQRKQRDGTPLNLLNAGPMIFLAKLPLHTTFQWSMPSAHPPGPFRLVTNPGQCWLICLIIRTGKPYCTWCENTITSNTMKSKSPSTRTSQRKSSGVGQIRQESGNAYKHLQATYAMLYPARLCIISGEQAHFLNRPQWPQIELLYMKMICDTILLQRKLIDKLID